MIHLVLECLCEESARAAGEHATLDGQDQARYEKVAGAKSNAAWWPNALNLAILHDLYLGDAVQAQALYQRAAELSPADATQINRWLAELKGRKPAPGVAPPAVTAAPTASATACSTAVATWRSIDAWMNSSLMVCERLKLTGMSAGISRLLE